MLGFRLTLKHGCRRYAPHEAREYILAAKLYVYPRYSERAGPEGRGRPTALSGGELTGATPR